jgi:hypothetical protein
MNHILYKTTNGAPELQTAPSHVPLHLTAYLDTEVQLMTEPLWVIHLEDVPGGRSHPKEQ